MVADIKFFQKKLSEGSNDIVIISTTNKDNNVLHAELGHPSEVITQATGRDMGLNLTGTFKPCEYCVSGKGKIG